MGRLGHDGVIDEQSLRVACAAEREVLMGYVPGFTRPLVGRSARKRSDTWHEDCARAAAIGNSFHTLSTAVLLGILFESCGFTGVMQSPDELQRRFYDELQALRLSSRERGYEQALESELVVLNPRHVLHEKSPMLAWAETEEALALDAEFGKRATLAGHDVLSSERLRRRPMCSL